MAHQHVCFAVCYIHNELPDSQWVSFVESMMPEMGLTPVPAGCQLHKPAAAVPPQSEYMPCSTPLIISLEFHAKVPCPVKCSCWLQDCSWTHAFGCHDTTCCLAAPSGCMTHMREPACWIPSPSSSRSLHRCQRLRGLRSGQTAANTTYSPTWRMTLTGTAPAQ